MTDFDRSRLLRWHKGALTYRGSLHGKFVGCPRHELYEELLDAANYADEWRRQGLSLWRYYALRCVIRAGAWLCR